MIITIDASKIINWKTFHDVFAEALGFPEFYGRNIDAWIDCMTRLDDDEPMTSLSVKPGSVVCLQIKNVKEFAFRNREQFDAIIDCSAFVNWRRIEKGQLPVLALSFYNG